jgi:hypothetical protein
MMPLFDFGTANFKTPEGKKRSFFVGVDRSDELSQPNKFSKTGDVNINPAALALVGAPLVILTTFILTLFILAPGFDGIPGFVRDGPIAAISPSRQAEVKRLETRKSEKAAEDAKAKAKEEAKKAAEAEAKAAEAKAAPAAKK